MWDTQSSRGSLPLFLCVVPPPSFFRPHDKKRDPFILLENSIDSCFDGGGGEGRGR